MEKNVSFSGSIPLNYDQYLGPFLFEPYAIEVASRLKDQNFKNILEIAAGTGRLTKYMSEWVNYENFTATDINPDMLEIAKDRIKGKNINWMQADAMELPFGDSSFDLVIIQFGIMFFPDKEQGLREAWRVLRKGGKIIYTTWDKAENNEAIYTGRTIIADYFADNPPVFYNIPFSMYDEKELKILTEEAGFRNVKINLVRKEGQSNATDLAIGMVEGNPVIFSILEKNASLVEPIKRHVAEELGKKHGKDPLTSRLQAWIIEGDKS